MKCKCVYWILSVKTVISYMEHLVCLPLLNDWLPASVGHWKARCQFKQLASWQICSIQNAFPGLTSGLTKPVFSGVWRGLDLSVPLCVCVCVPISPFLLSFLSLQCITKELEMKSGYCMCSCVLVCVCIIKLTMHEQGRMESMKTTAW